MGARDSTGSDVTAFVYQTLDEGDEVGHIAITDGGKKTYFCAGCTCGQLLLVEHRPLY
jgi:hypothetical protein